MALGDEGGAGDEVLVDLGGRAADGPVDVEAEVVVLEAGVPLQETSAPSCCASNEVSFTSVGIDDRSAKP